jgi:hypothetical protein
MLRKGNEIMWNPEAKNSFGYIKVELTRDPMISNRYFTKDFIMFSFTSENTIASVLLQNDEQKFENPIAYFSRMSWDVPLRYNIMEK